jgi:hypothetical protein
VPQGHRPSSENHPIPDIRDYLQNFRLHIAKVINRTIFGHRPNSIEARKGWLADFVRFSTGKERGKDYNPIKAINHDEIKL